MFKTVEEAEKEAPGGNGAPKEQHTSDDKKNLEAVEATMEDGKAVGESGAPEAAPPATEGAAVNDQRDKAQDAEMKAEGVEGTAKEGEEDRAKAEAAGHVMAGSVVDPQVPVSESVPKPSAGS